MEDHISKLKSFSKMDLKSKQKVIADGRPTPQLKDLLQNDNQRVTRTFQKDWYSRVEWLCGCAVKQRLFCFPCLLFSPCAGVWTNQGYGDLKNIHRGISKHERSSIHIQNQIALKTFGSSTVDLALSEQRRLDISTHNAMVKENREVLKDLINAACFLAKQELAFGGEEAVRPSNRGNYVELLHAFAEKDERQDVKKDIGAASFVAVEVDETTCVTSRAQVSVVLRYVTLKEDVHEVKEVFLGLDDLSDDIATHVLGVLEKHNCVEKLVAQSYTYDGVTVMAPQMNGVQAKIRERVPEAMFSHNYAHKMNLVLMHSAECMPETRTFFKTVEGLGTFFSRSSKRAHLLDDVLQRRFARPAPTEWLLQTIIMHLADLRAVLFIISQTPDCWDIDTQMMAAGYDQWLSKTSTCFLIMAYQSIFIETDALFKVLQDKVMDTAYCCERILDTVAVIEGMRREFGVFYERYEQKCATLGLTDDENPQWVRDERAKMYFNILDNISVQMRASFDHFGELAFLGLVDCAKFGEMSKGFNDGKLQSLAKYARFFDLERLRSELVGLYGSQAVRNTCQSPGQLLDFLAQKDLVQTVPEATKLLQLALTILATAASSSSALKRLKLQSHIRTDQERLSSLAIIAMEAERVSKLKENKEDFYNKVTELFAEKDERLDFIYK
ncbi:uncharacterized protein LOC129178133 isoform X2 [Dunckerocampus dactyliophorus]|uniref:uncharacterized protein LOC129178133 isoform X2 n=1 Tax=Dunckerocampus dactyliophorus TaxID=161453 RepID=UPI0024076EA5|nr:uncharacterized protein LOC129178133 isoform X2 [Dunckerocampus dactyliophorus]